MQPSIDYQKENGVGEPTPSLFKEKNLAIATTTAVARRRQNTGKRTVLIKAEKESDDNGKTATAQDVRAEDTILRAKDKQCDKDPKGYVITLITTSHRKPPVFCRRVYVKFRNRLRFLIFLLHHIRFQRARVNIFQVIIRKKAYFFAFCPFISLRKTKKCVIMIMSSWRVGFPRDRTNEENTYFLLRVSDRELDRRLYET